MGRKGHLTCVPSRTLWIRNELPHNVAYAFGPIQWISEPA